MPSKLGAGVDCGCGLMVHQAEGSNVCVVQMGTKQNKQHADFITAWNKALDEVERRDSAQALVSIGMEGNHIFSAGLDLDWLMAQDASVREKFINDLHHLFARLLTFPMPTVAAINGHAIAGGCMLAMAHDQRVSRTDKGKILLPEIDLGLPFSPGMNALLVAKIPAAVRIESMAFAHAWKGEAAKLANLSNDVGAGWDGVFDAAMARAEALAPKGANRTVMAAIKTAMWKPTVDVLRSDAGLGSGNPGIVMSKL